MQEKYGQVCYWMKRCKINEHIMLIVLYLLGRKSKHVGIIVGYIYHPPNAGAIVTTAACRGPSSCPFLM